MPRRVRAGCQGGGAAALLTLLATAALAQGPEWVRVGRVTAIYWSGDGAVATGLAEVADRAERWPGIESAGRRPIRLVITHGGARFDSVTGGRAPGWSGAVAYPGSNTIVLKVDAGVREALRHELAHLALHEVVGSVPRWFDEGYAARAANEWDRMDALRLNWTLFRGIPPTLDEIDAALRGGVTTARDAYAMATTAVLALERLGGRDGLSPLVAALRREHDFDAALRSAHQVTLGQFEDRWRRDLKQRYGWLVAVTSVGFFWSVVALVLGVLWFWRRRRDDARRARLDEGWLLPPDEWRPSA